MSYKKTDKCCRFCKHRGWGLVRRNQRGESIVCLLKPKVFKNPIDNIEPHYYATTMIDVCNEFERREHDDHTKAY